MDVRVIHVKYFVSRNSNTATSKPNVEQRSMTCDDIVEYVHVAKDFMDAGVDPWLLGESSSERDQPGDELL